MLLNGNLLDRADVTTAELLPPGMRCKGSTTVAIVIDKRPLLLHLIKRIVVRAGRVVIELSRVGLSSWQSVGLFRVARGGRSLFQALSQGDSGAGGLLQL